MSDIQRWEPTSTWSIGKDDSGNYVEYDDHAAIVAQLESQLAVLSAVPANHIGNADKLARIRAWSNSLDKAADYFKTQDYSGESVDLLDIKAYLQSQVQQETVDDVFAQIRKVRTTHSDDLAVDKFAEAMKSKLEVSRRVHGRGGWDNKGICSAERLQGLLLGHVAKGDPVDVGNFAMMLFNRGEQTKFSIASQPAQEPVLPKATIMPSTLKEPIQVPVVEPAALSVSWHVSKQPAQEPVKQEPAGIVEHWAAPANLPAYVAVKWNGEPPRHGTKVYVMPVEVKE